ncbi:MAG TPA: G1 family glutamic endopeptidase [Thermoplasmata archaeon]|nr:G1 family glutamic endopeptidase [Thermoplasmata archaeon]
MQHRSPVGRPRGPSYVVLFGVVVALAAPAFAGLLATPSMPHPPAFPQLPAGNTAAFSFAAHTRPSATGVHSQNWGGFVAVPATSGKVDEAYAEWHVAPITCPASLTNPTYHLTWVGIDGWTTNTVEQAGTFDYCSGAGATPLYYSWWEFFPYNAIQLMGNVSAGDLVQSYVLYNPTVCHGTHCGVYTLDFADLSSGYNFSIVGNPSTCAISPFTGSTACQSGNDTSAECISEAVYFSSGYAPISKYTNLSFANCIASIGGSLRGIGAFTTLLKVTTIGSVTGGVIQSPGILTAGYWKKSDFAVTWKGYD